MRCLNLFDNECKFLAKRITKNNFYFMEIVRKHRTKCADNDLSGYRTLSLGSLYDCENHHELIE